MHSAPSYHPKSVIIFYKNLSPRIGVAPSQTPYLKKNLVENFPHGEDASTTFKLPKISLFTWQQFIPQQKWHSQLEALFSKMGWQNFSFSIAGMSSAPSKSSEVYLTENYLPTEAGG
jgi:hypothetical protein